MPSESLYFHPLKLQTNLSELLDVVDDQDRVVDAKARGDIHARGLMHRSVHILVFDRNGEADDREVLLQKRSMQKDQCAGMWDSSCAGHVESGQTYDETVDRELQEELGISVNKTLTSLFKMQPTELNGFEFAMVYALRNSGPFKPAPDEIDELKWFKFNAADEWVGRLNLSTKHPDSYDLTSGFIEIWERFRGSTNGV